MKYIYIYIHILWSRISLEIFLYTRFYFILKTKTLRCVAEFHPVCMVLNEISKVVFSFSLTYIQDIAL